MKTFKNILKFSLVFFVLFACTDDADNLDFLNTAVAPSNVSALFQVTQDNTGTVTMTPNATGAALYNITLGDDTADAVVVKQGESAQHVYAEGSYSVLIEAVGITGLKSQVSQDLVVSFNPPELIGDPVIENDASISKQVNVSVDANFAVSFDVYFGEDGNDTPVSANIGETASYNYQEPGIYTIRIVVMGGAIETIEYTEEFEVTEISQPLTKAPTPPFRADADVISMYSEKYDATTSKATVDMFVTDWSVLTSQAEVLIDDNKTLVYSELNYAGIITESSPINASGMEYFHVDVWTKDVSTFKIKFVDFNGTGYNNNSDNIEFEIENAIDPAGEWVSLNIPLSDFVGVPFSDINQMVIAAVPAGTTVFLDNLYFWKEASGGGPLLFDDFEGNGNIATWAGDDCGMDNAFANPYVDANNGSATVLQYNDTGGTYANIRFDADNNFDLVTNSSFTLKIYVPTSGLTGSQPNQISLKLQDGTVAEPWSSQTEIIKPIVLDTWQEITFDFTNDVTSGAADPLSRTDFNRVVLQVNSEGNNDAVIAYIDDFSYGYVAAPDTPPFAVDDFEGSGTITTWAGDDCGMDNAFANPYIDAENGSATVLQYNDTGGTYANIRFDVTPNFDLNVKSKFTLKIYVPTSGLTGSQPNQISLKLQDGTVGEPWGSQTEIIKPIVLDTWQEITFDFANDTTAGAADPLSRTDFNRVVLQLNGEGNNDAVIAYIDNFNYHN